MFQGFVLKGRGKVIFIDINEDKQLKIIDTYTHIHTHTLSLFPIVFTLLKETNLN